MLWLFFLWIVEVVMQSASVVIRQQLDQEMMDDIATMRGVRLALAERQLAHLDDTMVELAKRGLIGPGRAVKDRSAVREELHGKICDLRSRVENNDVVYADELEFYLKVHQA
jgi:hypothetical protein